MLLGALQENLIVLLTFSKERAPIIRNTIDPALFGGLHRQLVVRIYDYLDKYKKPPADHLPDLFSDKLEKQTSEAQLFTDLIQSIHAAKEHVNEDYVMSQLETFVDRQSLRSITVELTKALQRDTDESLDQAKALISNATQQRLSVFDPGTRLSDKKRALKFLDKADSSFPTGIPELDRRGFGPTRKELWLGIANTGSGKSWMLTQLAKMALIHRLRVSHITLEMSEEQATQRYMQTLFAMAKRSDPLPLTKLQYDQLGRITGYDEHKVKPKLSLDDPRIRRKLERRIDKFSHRLLDNIFIKEFPTGQLTVNQLTAYLDNLENTQRFVPDLLLVDYPDLMEIDTDNYRLSLDKIYKGLRGIGVARNMAVCVVSQSHRGAAKAKQVGAENVAEAYSKIAHSDTVTTYTQTKAEKQLGLARLHVAKGRNDTDGFTIVITQQYAVGSFAHESALMRGTYMEQFVNNGDT